MIQIHRAYNDIVRRVATARGIPLIDLEKAFLYLPRTNIPYFADGIHFSPIGCPIAAGYIVQKLRDYSLV